MNNWITPFDSKSSRWGNYEEELGTFAKLATYAKFDSYSAKIGYICVYHSSASQVQSSSNNSILVYTPFKVYKSETKSSFR